MNIKVKISMKRLSWFLFAGLLAMTGCKDKKSEAPAIITTDYEAPKPTAPIEMQSYNDTREVEWVEGRRYTVQVTRQACDTLPVVTDIYGQEFIDNTIHVEVTRADGSVFYQHTFTKASFLNWLEDVYRKYAILQGLCFLQVDGDSLVFIVWLNNPRASEDEAVELRMELTRHGEIVTQRFTYDDRDDLLSSEEE